MSSFASEQPNNMVYYGIHSLLKPQEVTASEQRENFCAFDTLSSESRMRNNFCQAVWIIVTRADVFLQDLDTFTL